MLAHLKMLPTALYCKCSSFRGTWVAHSIKRLTFGFDSGQDITVYEIEPRIGLCTDSTIPAWDSLYLSFLLSFSLSKYINKYLKINK